jgi:hypothetical protein
MRPALTQKIWLEGHPEPSNGQMHDLPSAPAKWFNEYPDEAAKLYALEWHLFGQNKRTEVGHYNIVTLDTNGFTRTFSVTVEPFTDYRIVAKEGVMAPAVHVIRFGRALCGLKGVPDAWPPGHRWVAFNDPANLHQVTCPRCKEQVEPFKEAP